VCSVREHLNPQRRTTTFALQIAFCGKKLFLQNKRLTFCEQKKTVIIQSCFLTLSESSTAFEGRKIKFSKEILTFNLKK
jgi:hypothetical protein